MEAKHIQVIAAYKKDLREGLALLYECYGQSLYQFSAKNWGLDEDESYDILYKTLETVGKVISRNEFLSEKHFQNWLFKIHKNNTLMALRSRKAKEEIEYKLVDWQEEYAEADEGSEPIDFERDNVLSSESEGIYEEHNGNNPLFNALEKALHQISEEDRDILLLRMNNYSYDDIATMLGIANNQLKVKFLRAKAKIEKKTMDIIKGNLQ